MAKRMDPKLVAQTQPYELNYFARKHGISKEEAKRILDKTGSSREKANAEAEKLKK